MKLKCLECGHKYDGNISYDELGWHSVCPVCKSSFGVDVPDGKILVLFATRDIDWKDFKDNHLENKIYSYHAYNSVKSFMNKWRKSVKAPDSMWYWVIDGTDGYYITTGACCERDAEIFKDYFGKLS